MADGLTAAVRTNLIALQRISSDIGRVQHRLATGKRVNSPSDDPAAYFTASALNARAAALNTVLDGISTGKKVIEAGSAGIEAIELLIKNMRSLANQALTSPSTLAEVTGNVTGLTGATAVSMDNGDTITVSDGTTTATYTHTAGQDVQDFIDAVNNTANLNVEASLTSDGRIELKATGVNNVTVGGSASVGELGAIGLAAGTTTSTSNSLRHALAQQFDQVRTQIDQLAADAGLNGQNLLAGNTLSISLNENGSAAVTVAGSLVSASNLGIGPASGSARQLPVRRRSRGHHRRARRRIHVGPADVVDLQRAAFGGFGARGFHQGHVQPDDGRRREPGRRRHQRGSRHVAGAADAP